ncbi:MAG: hypothetical protein ACRC0L_12440 [Angustibacter sp.]
MIGSQVEGPTRPWVHATFVERAAFCAALVLQALVLYSPRAPGVGGGIGIDKLAHAAIFALPLVLGLRCGLRLPGLFALLLAHGVLSEVVQGALLAGRAGDFRDVLANSVGLTAVLLWRMILGPEPRP